MNILKPRSMRFSILGCCIFGLLTIGLGCQGLSSADQAAIAPITLNYWTVFGNVAELQKRASEYQKLRPYVTINIRQLRYEEFDTIFVNALADEVWPDIVSMHTRWLHKYVNRLAPMPDSVRVANVTVEGQYQPKTVVTIENNRLPTMESIKRNYIATVADDVVDGGQVYGLPLTVNTLALFYNKDLLDKAGVAVPPRTWAEFQEAVKKATKFDQKGAILQSGTALGTGKNIDNAFDIVSLLMMQRGVLVAQGNRVSFADGLDRNAEGSFALEALRFYTDFARPNKEVYSWNDNFDKAIDEFTRGRVVFFLGFGFDYARIRALAPQLDVAVVPLPQLNVSSSVNVANYWLESVVRKSKHQNEAWDFIRFLSAPDNIKAYSVASGEPSPLRVHVAAEKDDPILGPFAQQILTAKNWYHGRDIEAANAAMQNLLTRYLQPYRDTENPADRDANLVTTAAAVIQQTF